MPHTVLQISDCHLVSEGRTLLGVDTFASLQAVLGQAFATGSPDAILATGDIAHDPQPAVYRRFLELLQKFTNKPLLCLPGNHDVNAAMIAAGFTNGDS